MESFDFFSFKDFFDYHLRRYHFDESGKKSLTLKEFAEKLGYNSPSLLTMIAKGERLPSESLLQALFKAWKIPPKDREKIKLLVQIEKRILKGKDNFELAQRLNQISKIEKIDLKKFELISDWHILVIKILVGTPDFKEDPQWISQKLRRKISPRKAEQAIQLLLKLGYILRDPVTQKLSVASEVTETTHEIPSEAIRNNHKGMIQRALESVDEQNHKNRSLNSLALQFNKANLPKAREKLLNFIHEFNLEFSDDNSKDIYQLNLQLFEHTNGDFENDL